MPVKENCVGRIGTIYFILCKENYYNKGYNGIEQSRCIWYYHSLCLNLLPQYNLQVFIIRRNFNSLVILHRTITSFVVFFFIKRQATTNPPYGDLTKASRNVPAAHTCQDASKSAQYVWLARRVQFSKVTFERSCWRSPAALICSFFFP